MRRILSGVLAGWMAGWMVPGPAAAHPHIFIEASVDFIFDTEGRVTAVRVTWIYDDLYSLLVMEDYGLDRDFDGVLTEAELAQLSGFDMAWVEGYVGDLYVLREAETFALSGPLEPTADLEAGRIVTTHLRQFAEPVEMTEAPLVFQIYDPGFYTAYEITRPSRFEGRETCQAPIFVPNADAANQQLLDALAEYSADVSVEEMGFPAVGANFAEEVRLTCAPQS